jgi:type II secretory pathway pseudopilin PulG
MLLFPSSPSAHPPVHPLVFSRTRSASPGRPASPAFSLIELLTILAILAVLASLALPGMARTRDAAHAVLCRQHLRQWGIATLTYADDHDDQLPPEGFANPTNRHTNSGWYIQLPRQIGLPPYHPQPWRTNAHQATPRTVWLCPANRRRSNGRNLFHYCLNQDVDGTGSDDAAVRLSAIPDPSRAVWMFDSKNLPAVGHANFVHTNLHRGGAHFLFLSAHAAHFPRADYWDAERDRGRTNHPQIVWSP